MEYHMAGKVRGGQFWQIGKKDLMVNIILVIHPLCLTTPTFSDH